MRTGVDIAAALRNGALAVLPTDTVYGLVADGTSSAAVERLYDLKGRTQTQPTSLIFASITDLFASLPDLDQRRRGVVEALLPGPLTLVLPNPRSRFGWLTQGAEGTIGVRVPGLPEQTAAIVATVGAVAATSANLPGEADPRRPEDVPTRIREGVVAVLDGGVLPGVASTVVDLSRPDPVILRVGAVAADVVLARIATIHT